MSTTRVLDAFKSKKISQFFFEVFKGDDVTFADVWKLQIDGGGIYYLDALEKAKRVFNFRDFPNVPLTLIQFDIPEKESEQQSKLYEIYEQRQTKGLNPDLNSFVGTSNMSRAQICKFEYYSGYWRYSLDGNDVVSKFYPCDPKAKNEFLLHQHALAMCFDYLMDELRKTSASADANIKYLGLSLLVAIASYAFNSPYLLLGSAVSVLAHARAYNNNVIGNAATMQLLVKTNRDGGLLASSIFAARKEISQEANTVITPSETHGPG